MSKEITCKDCAFCDEHSSLYYCFKNPRSPFVLDDFEICSDCTKEPEVKYPEKFTFTKKVKFKIKEVDPYAQGEMYLIAPINLDEVLVEAFGEIWVDEETIDKATEENKDGEGPNYG